MESLRLVLRRTLPQSALQRLYIMKKEVGFDRAKNALIRHFSRLNLCHKVRMPHT